MIDIRRLDPLEDLPLIERLLQRRGRSLMENERGIKIPLQRPSIFFSPFLTTVQKQIMKEFGYDKKLKDFVEVFYNAPSEEHIFEKIESENLIPEDALIRCPKQIVRALEEYRLSLFFVLNSVLLNLNKIFKRNDIKISRQILLRELNIVDVETYESDRNDYLKRE